MWYIMYVKYIKFMNDIRYFDNVYLRQLLLKATRVSLYTDLSVFFLYYFPVFSKQYLLIDGADRDNFPKCKTMAKINLLKDKFLFLYKLLCWSCYDKTPTFPHFA